MGVFQQNRLLCLTLTLLHDSPPARRRRPDRAVEFSLGDPGLEIRPGVGRGQLCDFQTR